MEIRDMRKKKSSDFEITKEWYEEHLKNKYAIDGDKNLYKIESIWITNVLKNTGTFWKRRWTPVTVVQHIELKTVVNNKIAKRYFYSSNTNMSYFIPNIMLQKIKTIEKILKDYEILLKSKKD